MPDDIADLEILAHPSNYYTAYVALRSYKVPLSPQGVCLHTTEAYGVSSEWSRNDANANASWDYEVLRDGRIVRNVPLGCTAWTQGVRFGGANDTGWRPPWWTLDMGSYNQCMIGIEVQGVASQPSASMPEEQLEAVCRLVKWVSDYYRFPLSRDRLVGHEQLAKNKTDPTPYVDIDEVYAGAERIAIQEQQRRDSRSEFDQDVASELNGLRADLEEAVRRIEEMEKHRHVVAFDGSTQEPTL